ncbi:hypothetical protein [Terriglobus sp. RCC_193]|uniref:hypothetical protein n=1 Tax=Terriglobus sp. RCC_193 TaxID=3239218 RepID=UPI003524D367
MKFAGLRVIRILAVLFWIGAIVSLPALVLSGKSRWGWDLHVYANAIHSLRAGHDPYADGIAVQQAFHASPQASDPTIMPPYTYVYSPITLPVVRLVSHLPLNVSGSIYWAVYASAVLLMVWVGTRFFRSSEHAAMLLMAPLAMHFPGLLSNNVILSGNLAYILYGIILLLAWLGWQRGIWWPFYLAVIAASCIKAPLLTLLCIPVFSARKQWLPASAAACVGLLFFSIQRFLWPGEFLNYLRAVSLQFEYNHDFGLSPAGLLGEWLYAHHRAYTAASTFFYIAYAIPLLLSLFFLAKRYGKGDISLEQWAPVLLLGVVLLNPRIKEYDVAPLTLPLALIAWRLSAWKSRQPHITVEFLLFFLALQFLSGNDAAVWKPLVGCITTALYIAGAWQLFVTTSANMPEKSCDNGGNSIAYNRLPTEEQKTSAGQSRPRENETVCQML